jgi:hypothetical protein
VKQLVIGFHVPASKLIKIMAHGVVLGTGKTNSFGIATFAPHLS